MADGDPQALTEKSFTVGEVNKAVGAALEDAFPDPFWVVGEVQGYDRDAAKAGQRRWGQVYFELLEKEGDSDAAKASAKALMWGDAARRVAQRLGEVPLADGLKVRFLCAIDFYWPRASLQLKVLDVDPRFTLGDMEKARRELVESLKRRGLYDANRSVPLPVAPRTIGLITSEGSAAYHDFVQELRGSGYGFSVRLADARMQGEETERSVAAAFRALEADPEVEVIALVRGGGSRSDLMWFDREKVALAVARCPKPVVAGIGHEIDLSVADLVAHSSQKTPTACAGFIVERVRAFDAGVKEAAARLVGEAGGRVSAAGRELAESLARWRRAADARLREAGAALVGAADSLSGVFVRHLAVQRERLAGDGPRLARSCRGRLERVGERLDILEKELALKDPRRLLDRGYSLVRSGGKLLRDAASVAPGAALEVQFFKGWLEAEVTKVLKD